MEAVHGEITTLQDQNMQQCRKITELTQANGSLQQKLLEEQVSLQKGLGTGPGTEPSVSTSRRLLLGHRLHLGWGLSAMCKNLITRVSLPAGSRHGIPLLGYGHARPSLVSTDRALKDPQGPGWLSHSRFDPHL